MTRDSDLVVRVRAALREVPDVVERRMFGATAFMVNGKMCVTARAGRIMCRLDPDDHDRTVAEPGVSEVVMKGRVYRGYVHVAADAVSTKRALDRWVKKALRFNRTLTS